jgi:hypothetical protein
VLSGVGMGLTLVSSTIGATQGVPGSESGLASGLLNMSRLFGGALGLAVLSTIATTQERASASAGSLQALTDGFGLAFEVGAAFTIAAALVALLGLRPAQSLAAVPAQMAGERSEDEALAA